MEAKWQKQHSQIMELEVKKNKLLASNEALEKEKKECQQSLNDVNKDIEKAKDKLSFLDNLIVTRIREFNQQNEVLSNLIANQKQLSFELQNTNKVVSEKNDNLEKQQSKTLANILLLQQQIVVLEATIDGLKIEKQNERNEDAKWQKQAEADINNARQRLVDLTKKASDVETETQRQTNVLAIQKHDLEIYESRMIKKYPKETFIINESI